MWALFERLLKSEDGQDLVEYALLTAGIGFAGAGTWPVIVDSLGTAYATLDSQTQDLWKPNDPLPGGGSP
jgi:Flp pilus assembly pilin Flp